METESEDEFFDTNDETLPNDTPNDTFIFGQDIDTDIPKRKIIKRGKPKIPVGYDISEPGDLTKITNPLAIDLINKLRILDSQIKTNKDYTYDHRVKFAEIYNSIVDNRKIFNKDENLILLTEIQALSRKLLAASKNQLKEKNLKRRLSDPDIDDDTILKRRIISENVKIYPKWQEYLKKTKSTIRIPIRSNILINGVTTTGKSTFINDLFTREYWSFQTNITQVYLFSKVLDQLPWQNLKSNCEKLGIELMSFSNLDTLNDLKNNIPSGSVLIIDDFMTDALGDKKLMRLMTEIFNVVTHHNDIISIYTLHNLFADGFRTIRLNSNFVFLFSNPGDVNSIKVYFRQLEDEQKANLLFKAYTTALQRKTFFGVEIKKDLNHQYFMGFERRVLILTQKQLTSYNQTYNITSS